MRLKFCLFIVILIFGNTAHAQKKWNLLQCVEYAMANNISIKQTDLQTKISELQYKQSKMGQWPAFSFSTGPSFNNGRNP